MERLIGIAGILVLLSIALAMSNNRKAISWQLVTWGLGIQLLFAIIILKTPVGVPFFGAIDIGIKNLLSFSDAGSDFLFKSFRNGVVDFLDFHYLDIHWPAFNLADSFILISVIIYLIKHIRSEKIVHRNC